MTKKHINVQDLMDIRVSSEAAGDIVRAIQEGGATGRYAAGEDIPANRLVDLDAGEIKMGVGDGKVFGASIAPIENGEKGVIQTEGPVFIDAATDFSKGDLIACGPGGYAGLHQKEWKIDVGGLFWAGIAGADVDDDLVQTNLPDVIQAVCAGDETGNKMVVYGLVGTGFVKEEVDLGPAATYETTNTFDAVYCVEFTQQTVGTIDVQTKTGPDALIPTQIAGTTAARMYGAITVSAPDLKGRSPEIRAIGGTNNSNVVLMGIGPDENEQFEVVTMNGADWIASVNSWRTLDHILIGADELVWDVGDDSKYWCLTRRTVARGKAVDDLTGAGKVEIELTNMEHVPSMLRNTSTTRLHDDLDSKDLALDISTNTIHGLIPQDPTTPNEQITAAGNTSWRVNLTPGHLTHDWPGHFPDGETDLEIHTGSKLLDNGEQVGAMILSLSANPPTLAVQLGTPFVGGLTTSNIARHRLGSEFNFIFDGDTDFTARPPVSRFHDSDAAIMAAHGESKLYGSEDGYEGWLQVAYLVLARTADTTIEQRVILVGREERFSRRKANLVFNAVATLVKLYEKYNR